MAWNKAYLEGLQNGRTKGFEPHTGDVVLWVQKMNLVNAMVF